MADASSPVDPRFPNLSPEVVEGYLHAPEHAVAEVLDGELFTLPRPRPRHGRATTRLAGRLRPLDDPEGDEPGGWVILMEPELHLGPRPDIVDPDLAGWRKERGTEAFFEDDAPAAISLAPDWVCEVLSASTEALDRGRKMRIYRREGVGHLWLLSPERCTLEVYRLEQGRWVVVDTYEGDEPVRAEPFGSLALPLASLWAR